jgi:hypothetical protein
MAFTRPIVAEGAPDVVAIGGSAPFRMLASVLAHEMRHLRYGADEHGAYQQQLTTLAAWGAIWAGRSISR